MNYTNFSDERVNEVVSGRAALTAEEREFLVTDTPRFEECSKDVAAALPSMTDAELMRNAYSIWAEYASGQV